MNDKRKNNKKNETPVLILTAAVLAVTVIAAVILSSVLTGMHGGEGTAGQPATTGDPTETSPGTAGQPATDRETSVDPAGAVSPATAEDPDSTSAPATPGSSAGTSSPETADSIYTTTAEGPGTAGTTASQETKAEPDEITSQVTTEGPEDTAERSEPGYNADTSVPETASGQDETAETPDITEALTSGITTGATSQETSVTPVDTTSPDTSAGTDRTEEQNTTSVPEETPAPVTTSPVTTARPVETTSPVTTKKPTETSAPVTTAKPVETTSPADADYPVWGYEPAVPSGHLHSYKASETLEPTCEYGGYTLEKCSCGSTRMTGLTAKTGHTLQHAAYRLEPGELTADSLVMHVSFCGNCHKFDFEKLLLSDLKGYGIYAGSVVEAPEDIVFVSEGENYRCEYVATDLTTHVCPSMPSTQRPVAPADITGLPKVAIPEIPKNDKNSYPASMVMRDGSVVDLVWRRSGGVLALSINKESLEIAVGDCDWGWAFDDTLRVWTFGVWYHPQANTWYFKMLDIDPRFS